MMMFGKLFHYFKNEYFGSYFLVVTLTLPGTNSYILVQFPVLQNIVNWFPGFSGPGLSVSGLDPLSSLP